MPSVHRKKSCCQIVMFLSEKSSNDSSLSIGSFILLRSKQIESLGIFFKVCRGLLLDKYVQTISVIVGRGLAPAVLLLLCNLSK